MSYENLINGFIDGSLNSTQEENLFSAIASNEELRSQFKQQLAIDRTCRQYAASLTPPAQTTMGVFSSLGIKIKPIANTSVVTSTGAAKGALIGKIIYGITGAIIATILTSFVFIGYLMPENNNIAEFFTSRSIANESIENMLKFQDIPTSVPLIANYEIKNITSKNNIIKKDIAENYQKIVAEEQELIKQQSNPIMQEDIQENADNNSPIFADIEISRIAPISNLSTAIDYRTSNDYNSVYIPDFSYLQKITSVPRKFGLMAEVRGNQTYSLLNTSVPQAENVNFSNMGFSLLYNLSNDFSIGIGIRHENFPQRYEGTDESGNEFIYKQNPNLISIGIMGKYNFVKFGQFGLFGQTELGANSAGVLGRIAGGIEFTPENVIYMNLGLEATGLRYYHNDRIFYTPKAGFFYSIGVKF
jgi:hypothetical protein